MHWRPTERSTWERRGSRPATRTESRAASIYWPRLQRSAAGRAERSLVTARDNDEYVAARVLSGKDDRPALILGGRRGYLSAPLSAAHAEDALGALVPEALARVPEARDRWWWPYLTSMDTQLVAAATGAPGVHLWYTSPAPTA
jgi:hypothetical protein